MKVWMLDHEPLGNYRPGVVAVLAQTKEDAVRLLLDYEPEWWNLRAYLAEAIAPQSWRRAAGHEYVANGPSVDFSSPEAYLLSLEWEVVELDALAQVLVFDPGNDD